MWRSVIALLTFYEIIRIEQRNEDGDDYFSNSSPGRM